MKSKTALVPIAEGTEELEAVTIIDVLRRAGIEVTVASVSDLQVQASRGVNLVADCLIGECADTVYDLIVLPGGLPGAEHLRDEPVLIEMLQSQKQAGRYYAAICASPAVALVPHGLLDEKTATCYPSLQDQLTDASRAQQRVVVDDNCITSQGPGTAMEFAVELVRRLVGDAKADEVAAGLLLR
jgi:4-methyl-5(b-hydroxyethyl)-thiazole monophosphate biosynthesis